MLIREQAILALFFGLLIFLAVAASHSTVGKASPLRNAQIESDQTQLIHITGFVEEPGLYAFKRGISVKECLKKVKLKKGADRTLIPYKKILYTPQNITILGREKGENRPSEKISLEEKQDF